MNLFIIKDKKLMVNGELVYKFYSDFGLPKEIFMDMLNGWWDSATLEDKYRLVLGCFYA